MRHTHPDYERPRALYMPRTRGAVTGLILILLGAWGALIPFFGPNIDWAYMADPAWTWTAAKGWLVVLPGAVAAVGGLLAFASAHRGSAMLGGWLAVLGGAWFVVGRAFAPTLNIGDVGQPVASTQLKQALLDVTYFTGLGALISFATVKFAPTAPTKFSSVLNSSSPCPSSAVDVPDHVNSFRTPVGTQNDSTGENVGPLCCPIELVKEVQGSGIGDVIT